MTSRRTRPPVQKSGANRNSRPSGRPPASQTAGRRGVAILVVVLLFLFLVALVVLYRLPDMQQDPLHVEPGDYTGEGGFSLSLTEAERLRPFTDNLLLRVSVDKLEFLNLDGKVEGSIDVSLSQPEFVRKGDYGLVFDYENHSYYVFRERNLQYSGRTDQVIAAASLGGNGNIALVLNEFGTRGVLRVLDAEGQLIFDWTLRDNRKSGFILASAFNSAGDRLFVSMYNTANVPATPLITCLDVTRSARERIVAQYRPEPREPYLLLYPYGEDNLVAVSPRHVCLIRNNVSYDWLESAGFDSAGINGDTFWFVARAEMNGTPSFAGIKLPETINVVPTGSTPAQQTRDLLSRGLPLGELPGQVANGGKFVVLTQANLLRRIDVSRPNVADEYNLEGEILACRVDSGGNAICVMDKAVRILVVR